MYSTYLNDVQDVAYPLLGDVKRPFPDSVLVGLGLCLHQPYVSTPIVISQVAITAGLVDLTIVRGNELIGSITVNINESKIAYLSSASDLYSGFAVVGTVPDTCFGVYVGPFNIDPSCIRYDTVQDRYTHLVVDKAYYKTDEVLTINARGDIAIEDAGKDGSCSKYSISFTGDNDKVLDIPDAYSMVSSINGYYTLSDTSGITLSILVNDTSIPVQISQPLYCVFERRLDAEKTTPVIVVLEGTKDFPNCYTEDEAEDWKEKGDVL